MLQIVAPSNAAFKNIPGTALNGVWDPDNKDVTVPLLQYHILQGTISMESLDSGPSYIKPTLLTDPKYTNVTSGQNVVINKQSGDVVVFTTSEGNRCTVTNTDIKFNGGLIQVVDNLLIPPTPLGKTSEAFKAPSFLGSLYAAGLMPGIADRQNITIFMPQNDALEAVGGSLDKLDSKALARILSYHVVPNQVLVSSALTNATKLPTLANGASGTPESVTVRQAGNNKYINSAQIIQPDILIANGILHIISDVLNPDSDSVQPNPDIATQVPVYPVSTVKDAFTSALPCTTNCPVPTTASNSTSGGDAATTTTSLHTSSSKDAAAPARCTVHVAGAALGMIGIGAGMAWL